MLCSDIYGFKDALVDFCQHVSKQFPIYTSSTRGVTLAFILILIVILPTSQI